MDQLLGPLARASADSSASVRTVLVAFAANLLVAVAKTVAAIVTGSASILAEAAHSWADTGNEVFLFVANRRSRRPADDAHPLGYGREAYVWALLAALGLFRGRCCSIGDPRRAGAGEAGTGDRLRPWLCGACGVLRARRGLVLAVGPSSEAGSPTDGARRDRASHGDVGPDLRAVFAEDSAALIGLVIAAAGLGAHQLTGSTVPDAIGSILVGLLLAAVAIYLIDRNRELLIGEEADPRIRAAVIRALLKEPEVARVTYLRLEIVGPRIVAVTGDVDLVGDDTESHIAVRLRALEAKLTGSPAVAGAVLSLSAPDEPSLTV